MSDLQKAITALKCSKTHSFTAKNAKGEYLETPTGATSGQVVAPSYRRHWVVKAEDVLRQRIGVADD